LFCYRLSRRDVQSWPSFIRNTIRHVYSFLLILFSFPLFPLLPFSAILIH
jgi:hypothetical protein